MKIDVTQYCDSRITRNTHLLALEIDRTYKNHGQVLCSLGLEGWDIVENGIEQTVKEIADFLLIPYEHIEFESSDRLTKSQTFKHNLHQNMILLSPNVLQSWTYRPPVQPGIGLLIGRATNERLYTFWKSCKFRNTIRTCHLEIERFNESASDFTEFICEHNYAWQEIKDMMPYSDLRAVDPDYDLYTSLKQMRRYDLDESLHWFYDNIDIEIVCETNVTPGTFYMTEKIFHPLHYGRLFLTVGSPEFEKNMKDFGFDIFDDILDKSYDDLESYMRVDAVFNSLQKYLANPVNYSEIESRLIHNQKLIEKCAHERLL